MAVPEPTLLASNTELNPEDLKEMLTDVSDEELEKFVDQYSAKENLTN
jgi:hypothetical protein